MRILQLTSHLNVGGITRYVLTLSQRLAARGHAVTIAADDGRAAEQVRALGLTHWPLALNTSAEFSPTVRWETRRLLERLRAAPVDVIHAHTRVGQVVADAVSRRLGVPYVTTWHGIYRLRLGRRLWPCTGAIAIAISEPVRAQLLHDFHMPPARVRRIYNGIDVDHYARPPAPGALEAYRVRWGIPSGGRVIGGLGRLAAGEVKGFDLLLVAASLLTHDLPDLRVLIVGDGPRRPFLEDIARRLGLRDRVVFAGTAEDVRLPLALMDLFIFPSRWPEAFGLTLVEAMAAGNTVIATRMGAVPEIVRHGVDGWVVPPNDPEALANAAAPLLRDPEARRRFGAQAQARVRALFTLDRLTDEVEAVYREVVDARGNLI